MQQGEVREVQEWVQRESAVIERLLTEVRRVIVGQDYLLDRMMIGVLADGHLLLEDFSGSIHKTAAQAAGKNSLNGWDFWHTQNQSGKLIAIDQLRQRYRREHLA